MIGNGWREAASSSLRRYASFGGIVVIASLLITSETAAQESNVDKLTNSELAVALDQQRKKPADDANDDRLATLIAEAIRRGGRKPIYGVDNRQDWDELRFDPKIRIRANASAAFFLMSDVKSSDANNVVFHNKNYGSSRRLCRGEPFRRQTATAFCSGVLIGRDKVLTAGHCIQAGASNEGKVPRLADVAVVFGYYASNSEPVGRLRFQSKRVFRPKAVISRSLDQKTLADYAVIKLDREVPDSIAAPISVKPDREVKLGDGVYVVGYPMGLPVKYAAGATVRNIDPAQYFIANLDTYGGNSGSAVYSQASDEIVGILVRGETDLVKDHKFDCYRSFICPTTGCGGEHVMRINMVKLGENPQ